MKRWGLVVVALVSLASMLHGPRADARSIGLDAHRVRLEQLMAADGVTVQSARSLAASEHVQVWLAESSEGQVLLFAIATPEEATIGFVRSMGGRIDPEDMATWSTITAYRLAGPAADAPVENIMRDGPVLSNSARSEHDPICEAIEAQLNAHLCSGVSNPVTAAICDSVTAYDPIKVCPAPNTGELYWVSETDNAPYTFTEGSYDGNRFPMSVFVGQRNALCGFNPDYPNKCRRLYGQHFPPFEFTAMVLYRRTIHWPSGPSETDFKWSGDTDSWWDIKATNRYLDPTYRFYQLAVEVDQYDDGLSMQSPGNRWYDLGQVYRPVVVNPRF